VAWNTWGRAWTSNETVIPWGEDSALLVAQRYLLQLWPSGARAPPNTDSTDVPGCRCTAWVTQPTALFLLVEMSYSRDLAVLLR